VAGRCFLATYRPLVKSPNGRQAMRQHGLPPFVDGSCRREPDFESPFPSITAICRGGNFAPRLQEGDRIVYMTVKGRYLGDTKRGWRLIAALRVIKRFPSHAEAASWYAWQNQPLPSNCLVDGNQPKPFEFTNGDPPAEVRNRSDDPVRVIRLWDATYRRRADKWPVFLVTKAEFIELNDPPQLREADMTAIFSRIPATRTPPKIACKELERLVQFATGTLASRLQEPVS